MTARFATENDYLKGRKFVYIRINVSSSGIVIEDAREIKITKRDRYGSYRFSAFGAIEEVELGAYSVIAHGEFSQTGRVIDYAENLISARGAAIEAGKKVRDMFAARLEAELQAMRAAEIICTEVA